MGIIDEIERAQRIVDKAQRAERERLRPLLEQCYNTILLLVGASDGLLSLQERGLLTFEEAARVRALLKDIRRERGVLD